MKISQVPAILLALISLSLPACQSREAQADSEQHKIVATSPKAKDVTITQQYVCQIHSRRHIKVCAMENGYLEEILVSQIMPRMLMKVNLYSTDKNVNQKFLYNYAAVNILPVIKRIKGMGRARILGSRTYAMRVWLKLDRMQACKLSSEDVMKALAEQSVIGSPGRLGQATGKTSQSVEYVLTYQERYNRPEQYANIVLKANPEGEILRLKDVADVELGSEFFDIYSSIDGHPSASIVLKQSPGSNASAVIEEVKATLERIKAESFPPGMECQFAYDVSSFLDASIEKVLHTLLEAFVLVALVVYLFLGDWHFTLIPTLAVPVSLIGAFCFVRCVRYKPRKRAWRLNSAGSQQFPFALGSFLYFIDGNPVRFAALSRKLPRKDSNLQPGG